MPPSSLETTALKPHKVVNRRNIVLAGCAIVILWGELWRQRKVVHHSKLPPSAVLVGADLSKHNQ